MKRWLLLAVPFLIVSHLTTSCVQKPKPIFSPAEKIPDSALTVMTFNVENLFDTQDDPEKKDEPFLPLAHKNQRIAAKCRVANEGNNYRLKECLTKDWSEGILEMKMKRLTDVLKQVKNGRGPDILILQEVENIGILERWRQEYLADFGYKPAILIEGPDERGIDVGLLTRLETSGPATLHIIPFKANENLKADQIRATRGILEANLKLPDGSPLTVFGVHFPSQGGPTETRHQAVEFLNSLKAKLPADRYVIAGGDFNITSDEDIQSGYVSRILAKEWGVSHILGCADCPGTTYYPKNQSWSFFDILLVSQNMLPEKATSWHVMPASIRIENNSRYQVNRFGGPARFNENSKNGVTDHWPMVMEVMKK